jgi:hypothetical protein
MTATRKTWIRAFYWILALSAIIYLGTRLYTFEHWSELSVIEWNESSPVFLFLLVGLWGLNVFLESKKWQFLMRPVLNIPFRMALKQVFIGFSAGCFTPMRLGEAGGKALSLAKNYRSTGILASFYGSFIKTSVLFVTGISALLFSWYNEFFPLPVTIKWTNFNLILAGGIAAASSFLMVRHGIRYLKRRFRSSRGQVIHSIFLIVQRKNSVVIVVLTFLRWITYNLQLYVLFLTFGEALEWSHFFALSALYFAILTVVPSLFLMDLGIRGSVALAIFNPSVELAIIIIWAIFALWLFNVLLNACIGSILLLRSKR